MKIGIAAGHGRKGAEEPRLWEIDRCIPACKTAVGLLADSGFDVVTPPENIYELENNVALRKKVALFNDEKVDLSVEIHINAGGGNYSTSLFWDKPSGARSNEGRLIAKSIEQQFDAVCPWRSNGPKGQSYYGRELYFLGKTNHPSVITEIGFKDFDSHRDWLLSPSAPVVHGAAIALGLITWINGS